MFPVIKPANAPLKTLPEKAKETDKRVRLPAIVRLLITYILAVSDVANFFHQNDSPQLTTAPVDQEKMDDTEKNEVAIYCICSYS